MGGSDGGTRQFFDIVGLREGVLAALAAGGAGRDDLGALTSRLDALATRAGLSPAELRVASGAHAFLIGAASNGVDPERAVEILHEQLEQLGPDLKELAGRSPKILGK